MSDCLIWTGAKSDQGYGQRRHEGRTQYVHRLVYAEAHGPIPSGMEVDHTCRRPACYNVEHLRLATHKQNLENRAAQRNSKSGVRGVSWDERAGKWRASITHHGRSLNIGRYATLEAAANAVSARRAVLFTHSQEGVVQ